MVDCGFAKENHWFRYRTGGILIKDGKMLFVKSKVGDYYYMIGGAVGLGETSERCIEREIFEEAGIKAKAERLAVVCENFFRGVGGIIDGLDCHTLEFYYRMGIEENEDVGNWKTDVGETLVWLPIEEIPNSEIKPAFIKSHIDEIVKGDKILHVVWEKDR